MKEILVLSGGSIKTMYHLGALYHYSRDLNDITHFIGVSAGAIISFLLLIDYSPIDIYQFFYEFDFNKLKIEEDLNFDNLLKNYGLMNTNKILLIIKKFMKYKNINYDITLKELYDNTNKVFGLITHCIDTDDISHPLKNETLLDYKTFPDLKVLDAISMSISIPLLLEPFKLNGTYYVDGGCINNFPINYVDYYGFTMEESICIYVRTIYPNNNTLMDYLMNLLISMADHKIQEFIKNDKCLIIENKYNIDIFDFNLNKKDIKKMFHYGYTTAYLFINRIM